MPDVQPDDSYWRRPDDLGDPRPDVGPHRPAGYPGPPPTNPPPTGWRPEHVVQPPAPRALPAQDHERIDGDELKARGVTVGVAVVAAAVVVVVVCVLCARALF